MRGRFGFSGLVLIAIVSTACVDNGPSSESSSEETQGDGDGDQPGDGDGDEPGDGDGDEPGDGDGDEPGDGDGDGDGDQPRICAEGLTLCCPDGDPNCDDYWEGPGDEGSEDPQWQRWGCVDTEVSRYQCGGCSTKCPSDDLEDLFPGRCEASECQPIYQGCVDAELPTLTCDEVCASLGKTCAAGQCGFYQAGAANMRVFTAGDGECWDGNYGHTVDVACDEPIPAEEVPAAVACCCTL